jgi:methionyl aminopeptidase
MSIESRDDLIGMKRVGQTVAAVLSAMRSRIREGMTTAELDEIGGAAMKRRGARSAPQLTYGFPGYTCISVNDEIVHGVPGRRQLRNGDLVKIDVTAEQDGYIADAARTVIVGVPASIALRLQRSAALALRAALAVARTGERVSVIGRAVEAQARQDGFAVVRELCGHGVGRRIHEAPDVPNYETTSTAMLTEGLVIAVEPMLSLARCVPKQLSDGWTITTGNGALAVHEEHTIVVRAGAPLILTAA